MSIVSAGLPSGTRVWLAAGATDMRKGFTGLSALVQTAFASSPFCGHIFVFRGRRGDLLKVLWWDGTGSVFADQAFGAWALRVAASSRWQRVVECGAAFDAAGRD